MDTYCTYNLLSQTSEFITYELINALIPGQIPGSLANCAMVTE